MDNNNSREIAEIVDGPVSAEVVGLEKDVMVEEGKRLAALHGGLRPGQQPDATVDVRIREHRRDVAMVLLREGLGRFETYLRGVMEES